MPVDLDALVTLMPFAGQLGLTLEEADPERVVAVLAWARTARAGWSPTTGWRSGSNQ